MNNEQKNCVSRIGKTEFSFGLDFQAFYIKTNKENNNISCVYKLVLAFTRQGIQSASFQTEYYRQAHGVLQNN